MDIVVYTTPTCAYCRQVVQYLGSLGIAFDQRDVSRDARAAEEMVRVSGQQGVPVTVIDGEVIVGYDRPRLDAALASALRPRLGAAVADAEGGGAWVGRVRAGSTAEQAGLQPGDVLVTFAGRTVRGAVHLEQLMAGVQRGARIALQYRRGERLGETLLLF
ncbi:MAG: glutaredoxin domain-containing protein [Anaerolineae bacterium]|nr:PDZ domain-containing protein [Chloroflexota bacterium]